MSSLSLGLLDQWLSAPDDYFGSAGRSADRLQSGQAECSANRDRVRLDALREGSVATFEQLFFEYSTPLRRFTRGMVRSESVAEDIVQDVFAALWERRQDIDVKTTLRAYLYAAARGRSLTHLRATGVREAYAATTMADDVVVVARPSPDVLARLERDELVQALSDALAALSPRVRQAAELRWFGKLSHAEIASVMGSSPATVNNQLTTALRQLRERLREYLE